MMAFLKLFVLFGAARCDCHCDVLGREKKKRFAFEETALAVNWRAGTGGDISLYVCVCLYLYLFKRKRTREKAKLREKEYVRVFVCVPAIIQQLFMLTCVYV